MTKKTAQQTEDDARRQRLQEEITQEFNQPMNPARRAPQPSRTAGRTIVTAAPASGGGRPVTIKR